MRVSYVLALVGATTAVSAYNVPEYLSKFYDTVKNGNCTSFVDGNNRLRDGQSKTGKNWGYCDDTPNIVYLTGKKNLGDMDIDCDGIENCGDKKKKTASEDQIAALSFDETLNKYASDYNTTPKETSYFKSMNASVIPFVVLGTTDVAMDTLSGGPIEPLALVAVVCNGELHYAVFGDTNGSDNSNDNFTGEASLALAQMCFPNDGMSGTNGHVEHDVLYVAFTGKEAVPGALGAKWTAKTPQEFEASIKTLGDKLVAKAFSNETVAKWRTKVSETKSDGGSSNQDSKILRRVLGLFSVGWMLSFM